MSENFEGKKRLNESIDIYIDCSDTFALTDPADQIDNVVWAVEDGDISTSLPRVEGTDLAIVRVSGGTKLYSWHSVRATITCVSGQVYTPLVEIQLIR